MTQKQTKQMMTRFAGMHSQGDKTKIKEGEAQIMSGLYLDLGGTLTRRKGTEETGNTTDYPACSLAVFRSKGQHPGFVMAFGADGTIRQGDLPE